MPERTVEILVKRLGQKIIEEPRDPVSIALMILKDATLRRGPQAVLLCFIISRRSCALLKHHSLALEALEAMGLTLGNQHLAIAGGDDECLPLEGYLQSTLDDTHVFIVILRKWDQYVSSLVCFPDTELEVIIG